MRKLASIQKIKSVKAHPNADRLDILQILGWQCVSKKGEFKEGELCIYFEIDSLIPMKHEWAKFLQDKNKPDAPARLKTIRLRGELSQGLAVPLSVLGHVVDTQLEGDDVTEYLGVTKYEPKIPACLSGNVKGPRPSYVSKTDEDRVQAFPELIQEFQDVLVYVSLKIDGTSGTFAHMDHNFDVCGRNWSFLPTTENTYWEVCKKYDIENKLHTIAEETGNNYALQGEVAGPGIQKNTFGLPEHDLLVFNVINLNGQKHLGFYEFKEFCERLQLKTVPIIMVTKFEWKTIDELLALADTTYPNGYPAEGVVIRPVREFRSEVLKGRASFKVINNKYLEKTGE